MDDGGVLPIPPTSGGLICPISSQCYHEKEKEKGGGDAHQTERLPLPLLIVFEWFFTEKAFEWWEGVSRNVGLTKYVWGDWRKSNPLCCLTSDAVAEGQLSNAAKSSYKLKETHYLRFSSEKAFIMSTRANIEVMPGPQTHSFALQMVATEIAVDQTEVHVDIAMDPHGKGGGEGSKEVLAFVQSTLAKWFVGAAQRAKDIQNCNFDAVLSPSHSVKADVDSKPLNSPATSSPTLSSTSSTVGKIDNLPLNPHFERTRCSVIRRNWSVVLLVVLLSIVIPLMSLLFYRINVVNSLMGQMAQEMASLAKLSKEGRVFGVSEEGNLNSSGVP